VPGTARPASLYWFSQTLGPDRGLEAALRALTYLPEHWTLDLRGHASAAYAAELRALAQRLSISPARLKILPPAAPDTLPVLATSCRIGLAIEPGAPLNRQVCLANKIFTYLLGGTPVLLSKTRSHEKLAADLGSAARVIELEAPAAWAAAIRELDTPEAREHAWRLGTTRYTWDIEQSTLLDAVQAVLPRP
jgi:hypothetical protein